MTDEIQLLASPIKGRIAHPENPIEIVRCIDVTPRIAISCDILYESTHHGTVSITERLSYGIGLRDTERRAGRARGGGWSRN